MDIKKSTHINDYSAYAEKKSPKSNVFLECLRAFLIGGAICTFAQGLSTLFSQGLDMPKSMASNLTSVSMIFIGSILTGLGVYDLLGKFAGAGSIVPITGFANSIVSPAMEYRREGLVLGVGAKLFTIAGPVLVYGISASVLAGLIYFILLSTGIIM